MQIKIYNSWEVNPIRVYHSAYEFRRIYKSIILSKIFENYDNESSIEIYFIDNHWSNKIYLDLVNLEKILTNKFSNVRIYSDNPLDCIKTNIKYHSIENFEDDRSFVSNTIKSLSVISQIVPKHKFGYCIQRPDLHRISLLLDLNKTKLSSLFSKIGFSKDSLENADYWRQSAVDFALRHYDIKASELWDIISKFNISDLDDFSSPSTENRTNNLIHNTTNKLFCVDIVAESTFADGVFHISEKILRPILLKQPFVIFGSQHYYKFLKYMGFKTFDTLWDESWDSLGQTSVFEKSASISRTLQYIDQQYSIDALSKLTAQIVDHNYKQCINLFANYGHLYVKKHLEIADGTNVT